MEKMKIRSIVLAAIIVLTLSIGMASAGSLWIYNDLSSYDSTTTQEWIQESYIYYLDISPMKLSGSYAVYVYNTDKQKDAHDVTLEVWVRDNSSINTLQIDGSSYTAGDFTEGYHPAGQSQSENHGYFVTHNLPDIPSQSIVQLEITIEFNGYPGDNYQMHYHAEGKEGWAKTPNSHDLTAYIPSCPIPEFTTIAIPVASILGLLFFFNHRKHKKS